MNKIKILLSIIFILFPIISLSIQTNTTVPIYLEIPQYLKITYIGSGSLAQKRLDLTATIDDKNKWVSDSLDFRVESNVNYSLEISFEVESSLHQSDRNHINNEYAVKVKDSNNIEIINANKNSNHYGVAQRTLGISTYELIFELFIKNSILQVSGKIGEITITVSSI